jgi:hypothetical protein
MDVEVSWGRLDRESAEKGQDYAVMLQHADRLVIWDYFGLSGFRPEYTGEIARFLAKYDPDKIVLSIGLWARGGGFISPDALRRAVQAGLQSTIPNLWITPSQYLSDDHWKALTDIWGG